jgi:hypothetical protein
MLKFYQTVIVILSFIALASTVCAQGVRNDSLNPLSHSSITIATFSTISTTNRLSINPFISGNIGNYYFENRYNYEAGNSASINIGRTLNNSIAGFYVTPIAGLIVGNFKGLNTEVQAFHDDSKWYFSLDNQYVFEYADVNRSFYYNWLVGRYKLAPFLRIGVTTQFTKPTNNKGVFDRGITMSMVYKNVTFNIYAFNYEPHRRNAFISLRYYIKI